MRASLRVDRISFTQRYSAPLSNGGWRTLEMGAEASLEEGESLESAQRQLALQVRAMFKEEWERTKQKNESAPVQSRPPLSTPSGV
jgi:hypothetical protein